MWFGIVINVPTKSNCFLSLVSARCGNDAYLISVLALLVGWWCAWHQIGSAVQISHWQGHSRCNWAAPWWSCSQVYFLKRLGLYFILLLTFPLGQPFIVIFTANCQNVNQKLTSGIEGYKTCSLFSCKVGQLNTKHRTYNHPNEWEGLFLRTQILDIQGSLIHCLFHKWEVLGCPRFLLLNEVQSFIWMVVGLVFV